MSKSYAGVEDLLCDESFLSWYFKTDVRAMRKWDAWIAANPDGQYRVEQAVAFLQTLRLQEAELDIEQITTAERQLLDTIRAAAFPVTEESAYPLKPMRTPGLLRKWMAAASILLFMAGAYGGYKLVHGKPELRAQFGEIKANQLPDGTEVTVNADSRITYSSGWQDGKDREVWLKGEAFFHVRKTPLKSRFIVHTDHFNIIVTGTQFNVVAREDKASVMLKEGSVILQTEKGKVLKLVPGDFVEYSGAELEKKTVRNDSLLAWKDHKLLFDNTPVREVARIIREHYGINVQLSDENVGDKTVSGILANDNLESLLKALEAVANLEITQDGDKIIIRDHS